MTSKVRLAANADSHAELAIIGLSGHRRVSRRVGGDQADPVPRGGKAGKWQKAGGRFAIESRAAVVWFVWVNYEFNQSIASTESPRWQVRYCQWVVGQCEF